MFKKTFLFLVTVMFIFGMSKLSFAMMCGEHGKHQQIAQAETEHKHESTEATAPVTPTEAVNAGNKICPVSDEKIDEKMRATYEYEGKIYNFCCAGCIEEFKKDPQRYIKKVEEELKKQAKEQKEITPTMHEGHQH